MKDHSLSKRSQTYNPILHVVRKVEMDAKGRRFPCACGAVMTDGGHALEHFAAHGDVGIEEYRNGAWHQASYKNIGTWLFYRLREKGQSPEDFLKGIQMAAEKAKMAAELTENN